MKYNKYAIINAEVCLDQSDVESAVDRILAWAGSSEADREPIEVEYWHDEGDPDEGEAPAWVVSERLGLEVFDDGTHCEEIARYATEAEAKNHADRHNAQARQDILDGVEWVDLPFAVNWMGIDHGRGNYPQTRLCTIHADLPFSYEDEDGETQIRVEGRGWGDVQFLADPISYDAVERAEANLLEKLREIAPKN